MTLSPFVKSPLELVRADQFLDLGEDVQAAAAPAQFPGQSTYWWIQVPLEKVDQIEEGALYICYDVCASYMLLYTLNYPRHQILVYMPH